MRVWYMGCASAFQAVETSSNLVSRSIYAEIVRDNVHKDGSTPLLGSISCSRSTTVVPPAHNGWVAGSNPVGSTNAFNSNNQENNL